MHEPSLGIRGKSLWFYTLCLAKHSLKERDFAMRHGDKQRKFNMPKSQRRALFANLTNALLTVALSAAVGADDGRDAAAELQFRFLCKGFEPLHLQLCQSHARLNLSMAIWAAAWPAACLEGPEPTPHSTSSTSTRMVNSFL